MNGYAAQAYQAANTYKKEQLMNLSPVEVIQKLFDITIVSLKKNDVGRAQRALNELIVGLNFEAGDMAMQLYQIYDFCKRAIRKGEIDVTIGLLEELRSAWAQAFKLN